MKILWEYRYWFLGALIGYALAVVIIILAN